MDPNLFVYAPTDIFNRIVLHNQNQQRELERKEREAQLAQAAQQQFQQQEKLRRLQAAQAMEALRLNTIYPKMSPALPTPTNLAQLLHTGHPLPAAPSPAILAQIPPQIPTEESLRQQLLLYHAMQIQALSSSSQPSPCTPLTPLSSPFVTLTAPQPVVTSAVTTSFTPMTSIAASVALPLPDRVLPTPDTTPSPTGTLQCAASPPSTSSSTAGITLPLALSPKQKNQKQPKTPVEEDLDGLFIDVESVDLHVDGKDRRKAHIEFYRRLKSIRQREKKLTCALCFDIVDNYDNALRAHVHSHATQGCFRCQVCGWETHEKNDAYKHIESAHPGRNIMFEDRRDMARLCQLIQECFPKTGSKMKQCYLGNVDKFVKGLAEKGESTILCQLCEKPVPITKHAVLKHTNAHPTFRCKQCKYTCDTTSGQEEHCRKQHDVASPKLTVDFNLCSAADVMSRTLTRCFGPHFEEA